MQGKANPQEITLTSNFQSEYKEGLMLDLKLKIFTLKMMKQQLDMLKTINCRKREELKTDQVVTVCYKRDNDTQVQKLNHVIEEANNLFSSNNRNYELKMRLAKNSHSCRQLIERIADQQDSIRHLEKQLERENKKLDQKKSQRELLSYNLKKAYDKKANLHKYAEEAKKKFMQTENFRSDLFNLKKRMNNQLQQLRGSIRVYCRIRPSKAKSYEQLAVQITKVKTLKLKLFKQNVKSKIDLCESEFHFEQIFSPQSSQENVFTELQQLIQSSVDGKNVCIFAYGQTGSGKTHTLHGPDDENMELEEKSRQRGITPRSISMIFDSIQASQRFSWKYRVFLSIQEIYLQNIIDLIQKESIAMDKQVEIQVENTEQVISILNEAKLHRKKASTQCNERSSRSHLIVTLRLQAECGGKKRCGSLVLVDLAGSERLKQSKVEGDNLKETQFINKSLSSLGNVINGLSKKDNHIPFRNSKLTHVLQKYLQGDSKTLMFVNISPDLKDAAETKISLGFAESVKEAKLKKL